MSVFGSRPSCNWFSTITIIVICMWLTPEAHAQLQLKQISTPEGLLAIHPGKGTDCYSCDGLFLDGKQILHNQYVSINAVYPSQNEVQLVSIESSNGGNCCPPTHYILDFSVKPHIVIKGVGFDNDIARTENGVVFTQSSSENDLGDPLLGVYEYRLGSGRAIIKTTTPMYVMSPINQKKYGSDVLSDPTIRGPLVALLGVNSFSTFRHSVQVSGGTDTGQLKIFDESIVVASGCTPHVCDLMFGMFIIDNKKKLAWAVEADVNDAGVATATIWGAISKKDTVVASEIANWLELNKISTSSVSMAPLPQSVRDAYASQQFGSSNESSTIDNSGLVKIASVEKTRVNALAPVQLFKMLSPSIYVVNVTRSDGNELQGSAVAVSSNILLTNCHVVSNSSSIILTQNKMNIHATLVSADDDADRCILKTESALTSHVPIRSYDELNIGERVYSIGAPAGLELTMSDGLLSGKRTLTGRRFVQTTAPISPGSSGGGLFDEAGNLIGITTFKLKGMENLNFAISAGDYLVR